MRQTPNDWQGDWNSSQNTGKAIGTVPKRTGKAIGTVAKGLERGFEQPPKR